MPTITYKRADRSELIRIKTLWEELNIIHLADSVYFKEHYAGFSFEKRRAGWLKSEEKRFQLLLAETENLIPIGYCVATIQADGKGEIDSLFVLAAYRKQGIGKTLVGKSMEWLQSNQCSPIRLTVSYGHESVLDFYKQLGFYPRMSILEWRNKDEQKYENE